MSARIRLAGPEDAPRIEKLMRDCHVEAQYDFSNDDRATFLAPLLSGDVPAAAYLIGPPSSPVGYLVVCFGYSAWAGGLTAQIDDIFVRPTVRGRGMATEAVHSLATMLKKNGVRSISAILPPNAPKAIFARLSFRPVDRSEMRIDL